MLVRRSIPLIAVVGLLIAGCGGGDDNGKDLGTASKAAVKSGATREIRGPWVGKLRQAGLAPFRVAVIVNSGGTGLVAYTGIDCGGHWMLESGDPPSYTFSEEIASGSGGNCKGRGTVHIRQTPGGTLRYLFEGGGVTSSGFLAPASFRAIATIWKQAGLHTATASLADKLPK
jgi:hypothetical protein